MADMTLDDVITDYAAGHPYGVSAGHLQQLRYSVSAWSRQLGRAPTVVDLAPGPVNAWIDRLVTTHAASTCKSQRGNLLLLWRHAFDQGWTDVPPLRVRRLRPVRRLPQAWTQAEILALIAAAEQLRGRMRGGPPRATYWSSLIRTAYDTALRLGDLLALTWPDVQAGQTRQHKTGQPVRFQVRQVTRSAILALIDGQPPGRPIWHCQTRREALYRQFRCLVDQAEICPGTFRWIRRTAVTQLERVAPGQGTRLAGHAHRATTEAWYIDRSQLDLSPLPPLESVR